MGQGNIIGRPNLPATTGSRGVWSLREQYTSNRDATWPGYDPQWSNTSLLLKTASTTADTFIDSSPNNFAVTKFGDTIQTTSTPYAPYWSNYFDGSGDYLSYSSTTTLNFGTADFTVEGWINLDVVTRSQAIVGGTAAGAFGLRFGTAYAPSSGATAGLGLYKAATADNEYATFAFVPKQWYHVAVTRQSGTVRFFVNGTLLTTLGSGYSGYTVPTETNVRVGTSDNGAEQFTGFLSNLRVVKGTAVYTASFTAPTAPLTAITNTSLLTCQDSRFKDNSTNNFTLTRTGDVAVSRFSPFAWAWSAASGGSGFFDGTGDYLSLPDNVALQMGTGSFTLEFWWNPTDLGVWQTPFDKGFTDAGGWLLQTGNNGAGVINVYMGGSTPAIISNTAVRAGAWNHIAVVRNGTALTLYQDGVSVGTATNSTNLNSTSTAYIGVDRSLSTNANLRGHLANMRLVKGTAVYTANFTPPTAPVTAIANTSLLLNFTNAAFTDTATGNVVRQVGTTVSRGRVAPSAELTSVGFNGGTEYLTVSSPSGQLGAGDFTVEAWVHPFSRISNLPTVWSNYSTWGAGAFGLWVGHSSHTTNFSVGINGTYPALVSTSTITYNTWTHLAVVRSNGVIRLYVNGVSEGGTFASTAVLNQGAGSSWVSSLGDSIGTSSLNGFISNLRVERSARYTANFTPDRTPITTTANTALALNQTVDVWDATAKNNLSSTGTIVSTPFMFTGSALSLAGNPQLARVYSGTLAGNFAFGTADFTIEAWIYPTSTSGYRCIFSTRGASANAVWFGLETGTYTLVYYNSPQVLLSTRTVPANAWSHVALVRSNGVVYFYINGMPAGSVANTVNLTESVAAVGFNIGGNTDGFIGTLDEVRVTKAARYLGAFTPSSAPFDRDWEPFYNDTLVTSNVLQLESIGLGGATNNVFRDDSSNAFLPTRVGDTTQGSLSPYIPTGYWSNYFDGSGDYLTTSTGTPLVLGTGDFTVECWVNKSVTGTANLIVFGAGGGGGANDLVLYTASANELVLYANTTVRITGPSLFNNRWHHIAAVRASGTTRLYLDGLLVGSWVDATNYTANTLTVGWPSSTWNGFISNFRVVKGTAVYTGSTFTPPTAPLTAIANTSLLTLQDNRFLDRSTNNFALTRTGDVSVQRFSPFPLTVPVTTSVTNTPIAPASLYFDGTGDYLTLPVSSTWSMGTSDFTVECWVYLTGPSAESNGIFQISDSAYFNGTNGFAFQAYSNNNNVNTWYIYSGNGTVTQGPAWSYNTWYHCAVVRSSGTTKLYINGSSVISVADTTNYTGTYFGIGAIYSNGDGQRIRGNISNFRLLKGTAAYTANFTPPTAPLTAIANTSLLINGASISDSSTNNFAITSYGNVATTTFAPSFTGTATTTTGRPTYTYGGSGYFDGSGDYLTVPDSTALQMGTGSFTVEFWWNPINITGYQTPFDKGYNGAGGFVLQTGNGNGILGMYVAGGTVIAGTRAVTVGSWNHVALVRSGTTVTLYINGVSSGTATNSTDLNNTTQMGIGANVGPGTTVGQYPINGYLSNLRVVKGTAVYTAAFTPPTSPVTAISGTSLLLNFDNAGIYDGTGKVNLLTAGTAVTSTTARKYDIASQSFDATNGCYVLPVAASNHFAFGTGDFTIEMWIYRNDANSFVVYGSRPPSTQGMYPVIYCEGATLYFNANSSNLINGGTLAAGQWYHIAVSRAAAQTRLFVNGVRQGATYADTNSYLCAANRPLIGTNDYSTGTDYKFNGYIENLRISRVGRYTANFTVPSESFPVA